MLRTQRLCSPPLVHTSTGQNRGGGLYEGSLLFRVTTVKCRVGAQSALFLAVWWAKFEKNDKVRHNNIMTQIASCSYCFYYQSERVGLIRETKLTYAAGELMGIIAGFYSIRLIFFQFQMTEKWGMTSLQRMRVLSPQWYSTVSIACNQH